MPGLIIRKMFEWRRFMGLPARFQTATASFSEKRDQAPHLLIFLRSKTRLKPANLVKVALEVDRKLTLRLQELGFRTRYGTHPQMGHRGYLGIS
jgi:hypothetical protein